MHHICSRMNSVSRHRASLIFTLGIDKILTDAVLFQRLLPDYKKIVILLQYKCLKVAHVSKESSAT